MEERFAEILLLLGVTVSAIILFQLRGFAEFGIVFLLFTMASSRGSPARRSPPRS